jgi:serine/threonine protein kinase
MIRMVIFAHDKLEDGVMPEVEVLSNMLSNMLSYFGPLPPALLEHVRDPQWCSVLTHLDQSFNTDNPRKPFSLWRDIEGLEAGDKEFFGQLLNLAPGNRPTAEDLLKHSWFSALPLAKP